MGKHVLGCFWHVMWKLKNHVQTCSNMGKHVLGCFLTCYMISCKKWLTVCWHTDGQIDDQYYYQKVVKSDWQFGDIQRYPRY